MAYQRFLDIHLGQDFGKATFKRDVAKQRQHQEETKKSDYRSVIVDELSVTRGVVLPELEDAIAWVCAADTGRGGKLRINSHGNRRGYLSTNLRNSGVLATDFAAYLVRHGLGPENGDPGLKTINLACCYSASGPQDSWMIKAFADALKMPGVKVTGAAAVTMMRSGVLHVEYEAYVPPHARPQHYVPPHLRTPRMATSKFSGSVFKKEYTYAAPG